MITSLVTTSRKEDSEQTRVDGLEILLHLEGLFCWKLQTDQSKAWKMSNHSLLFLLETETSNNVKPTTATLHYWLWFIKYYEESSIQTFYTLWSRVATKILRRFSVGLVKESIIKGRASLRIFCWWDVVLCARSLVITVQQDATLFFYKVFTGAKLFELNSNL